MIIYKNEGIVYNYFLNFKYYLNRVGMGILYHEKWLGDAIPKDGKVLFPHLLMLAAEKD